MGLLHAFVEILVHEYLQGYGGKLVDYRVNDLPVDVIVPHAGLHKQVQSTGWVGPLKPVVLIGIMRKEYNGFVVGKVVFVPGVLAMPEDVFPLDVTYS